MTTLSIVPTSQGDALIVDGAALLCVVKTPPEVQKPDPKSAYMQGRNIGKTAAINALLQDRLEEQAGPQIRIESTPITPTGREWEMFRKACAAVYPGQILTAKRSFSVFGRVVIEGESAKVVSVCGDYVTIHVDDDGMGGSAFRYQLALDRIPEYFFPDWAR